LTNLQDTINDAQCGDTIIVKGGETYTTSTSTYLEFPAPSVCTSGVVTLKSDAATCPSTDGIPVTPADGESFTWFTNESPFDNSRPTFYFSVGVTPAESWELRCLALDTNTNGNRNYNGPIYVGNITDSIFPEPADATQTPNNITTSTFVTMDSKAATL
jgi:hypothetical protein